MNSLAESPRIRADGFTLIELIITVAVVTVLITVAVPSYKDSVRKGRRGDAKAELMRLAIAENKYRVMHTSYANLAQLGGTPANPYYTFAVGEYSASGYAITATPQNAGDQHLDACGTLTISESAAGNTAAITATGCANP